MSESMLRPVEICDKVYWVGAVDWEVREFHGHHYHTPHGTSYNAYFVRGEKTALIDTVHAPFAGELLERLQPLVSLDKLDYMVVNHVETDHAGSLAEIMRRAPQAMIICSPNGEKAIRAHFAAEGWKFQTMKTGDTVDLGGLTLSFMHATMLHWPDSMFTYIPELSLLMPNDAFGQHLASSDRYNDTVDHAILMDEASKYYANILTPYDMLVEKKLKEVAAAGLQIKMIAPSHGVIWRKNPGEIVAAYQHWATSPGEKRVIVAFETMWESTQQMAHAIVEGVEEAGVTAKLCSIPMCDRTELMRDIVESQGLVLGCSTINKRVLPGMAAVLEELRGLHPEGKIGFAFGSHGWGGGAIGLMEATLAEIKAEKLAEGIGVIYRPTPEVLAACKAAGRQLAEIIRRD